MEEFQSVGSRWLTSQRRVVALKTTTRRLTSLKTFARFAGWGEPFADYQAPKAVPGEPHPIPEGMDGVRRMIEVARKDNHKALIGLCGMAGLRIHEALAVRASDFDMKESTLRVLGKNEKVRVIPISEELWGIIAPSVTESFLEGNALVVGLTDRPARKVVTNLAEKAGLERHVKSHDLRATFATTLYNKTLDINVTRIILGHASVETTQIYMGTTAQALREAVAKI